MGMIQSLMKRAPEGKTGEQFLADVQARLPQFSEGADSAHATLLDPQAFTQAWHDQENLKREPAIEEKYRTLTQQGRVVFVEIDW